MSTPLSRSRHFSTFALTPIALVPLLVPTSLAAQTGLIAGRVVVASTREPLVGAQLVAEGVGGVSDSLGRFVLRGVPVGVRRVEVRRIGFVPTLRAHVAVNAGRPAELEVELTLLPTRLGGVTVRPAYFAAEPSTDAPVTAASGHGRGAPVGQPRRAPVARRVAALARRASRGSSPTAA